MLLSIVVVNWNTTALLRELLDSLRRFPISCAKSEIIVIDNASSDLDESALRAAYPEITLIANEENVGYACATNQGIDRASGDYVLLLNPDTQVTEGALDTLVRFAQMHPDVAAVSCKLVRPDGSVELSVRGFPYPFAIACEYIGLSKLLPYCSALSAYRRRTFDYDKSAEVDQPMASCLLIGMYALERVGTFDESFPIFFNDVDWLYRAKKLGYRVYYLAEATVIHHGGAATRQVDRRKMLRESHDSLLRFYDKHFKGNLSPLVYYFTISCIKLSRILRG